MAATRSSLLLLLVCAGCGDRAGAGEGSEAEIPVAADPEGVPSPTTPDLGPPSGAGGELARPPVQGSPSTSEGPSGSPDGVNPEATGSASTSAEVEPEVDGAAGTESGGAGPFGGAGTGGEGASAGMGGVNAGGAASAGAGAAGVGSAGYGGTAGSAGAAGSGSAESAGGAGTGVGGGAGASGCVGGKVVHFVYFVEADQTYSESQRDDVERQAFLFQEYWYGQLGVTFYLNEPVVDVIEADHESAWYIETPDGIHTDSRWYRLGNVKTEVYEKLGITDFDDDHRVVNYPTTRSDGRVGGNFGGAWMDGDDLTCISGETQSFPYDDGNAAHCLGHPVHEFGHILGLDHTGPNDDCMQYGFYLGTGGDEMCDFSADNREQIANEPDNVGWFEALPGDTCSGK